MKKKVGFKERAAYWFDNYMSAGAWSIFLALLVLFLIGFALIALTRLLFNFGIPEEGMDNGKIIWRTFLALTDPGNMNQDNTSKAGVKIFTIISGIYGIIFFSAVIAFITTQLDLKLEKLKKGKSRVLEEGHILILGWSKEIVETIKELIIANESESRASIVILAPIEKEEMDDFLNEEINDKKTTKIITRTGDISSLHNLEKVGVTDCKSIIILPDCNSFASNEDKAISDAHTLKAVLAVVAATKDEAEMPNIVTQVFGHCNRQIMNKLAPESLTIVDPEDMIAKIAVQTSRSTGLAAVYTSLIGFDDCEFYFTSADWGNRCFGEIQYHFKDGVAAGIRKENGEIIINPPIDYRLKESDELILLAEDDSTIDFKDEPVYIPRDVKFVNKRFENEIEKALIIGWNRKGSIIVEQYSDYIVEGSEITIVVSEKEQLEEIKALNLHEYMGKNRLNLVEKNLLSLKDLVDLKPENYNSIIILNSIGDDVEMADARTINILLLIREAIEQARSTGLKTMPQLITEVMSSENLELISHAGVNDSIISTKMVSKILAQVAEEPDVLKIYDDIFEEDGSEIYLKSLNLYSDDLGDDVKFGDLIALAQKRGEICIGYQISRLKESVEDNFGIMINPPKDVETDISSLDYLIVIAEDEL